MEWIQSIDTGILLFIQEHMRNEAFHGFWRAITFLGSAGWFWLALAVILLIPKKTRKAGFTALLSMGIGALITNVFLKNAVARIRPYDAVETIVPLVGKLSDYSFPSGHTCASFAAAMVYLKMLPKKYGVPFVILAVLIAFSRLYVGVHYLTDVIGGLIIGIFSAWTAVHLMEYLRKRMKKSFDADSR